MGVVFFCQSCGARFEVDPRAAGKKGRCKKCGQLMLIPHAEHIATMAGMPAPVGAGAESSAASWLKQANSNVGLSPLTADRIPIAVRRGSAPSPLDDADDSKPYLLAKPERGDPVLRRSSRGPNFLLALWRGPLGAVQMVFRQINETAYLISVPFLIVLMLGAAVRSRPLALFGATVVVLLNLGRVAAGAASLAVVPFRDGIHVRKMKKPFRRVVEPALTIGLVVLAFTFIPWLATGDAARGTLADRLRAGPKTLERAIEGEVEQAKALDVEKLSARAKEKLKALGTSGDPGTPPPDPDAAIGGLIKGVGERARDIGKESQDRP